MKTAALGCRLLVPILAASLAACGTTALSGSTGAPIGGIQSDGSYRLTAQEQALNCPQLQHHATTRVGHMQSLPARAKAELDAAPLTMTATFSRYLGSGRNGLPAVKEFNQTRVQVQALVAAAASKNCPLKDVDKLVTDAVQKMDAFRNAS